MNVLAKAFAYDSGDKIYNYFMMLGMALLAVKLVTTKYTMKEIFWSALFLCIGLCIMVITKKATLLFLFLTIIGMKGCSFQKLIQISVGIRLFVTVLLVLGSVYGVYDIGYKTTPNAKYVEVPVYSFSFGEPNMAFLSVFLLLMLLIYSNYEKLNIWWLLGTSLTAGLFYEFTFCRTGIIVFVFGWVLILFEKLVKSSRAKGILTLSIPVGALFSFAVMVLYREDRAIMKTIDRYVSGRVNILGGYYRDQGIALFPRNQEFFYASYHGLIDNSYMYILLYCGVIFAAVFFVVLCRTLFVLYKKGCYKELVMLGTFALYGVLEQFVLNGFMNPFILLTGILLYPNLLDEPANGGNYEKILRSSNS